MPSTSEAEAEADKPSPTPPLEKPETGFNASEVGIALCREQGWTGSRGQLAFVEALKLRAKQEPERCLEELANELIANYQEYRERFGSEAMLPRVYFEDGLFNEPKKDDDEIYKQVARACGRED